MEHNKNQNLMDESRKAVAMFAVEKARRAYCAAVC